MKTTTEIRAGTASERRCAVLPLPLALGTLGICLILAGRESPGSPAPIPPTSLPVAGRVLTLREAITIALETQPLIHARLADYAAARQRVNQALSAILPQLSGNWTTTREKSESFRSSRGSERAVPEFSTTSTAELTLSQILFDFGKTLAATDAARAQVEVARLDAEVQKDLTVLAVKQGYFNLLLAKRLVTVNDQAVARANLNLASAKGFLEVGTRPKIDVVRAEVDVANAQVALIQARNAVSLARVALNTAMGIPVETPTEVRDILTYKPYPVDQGRLIPKALLERPEYRRLNAVVTSAEASVRQSYRDFFPDISGVASYGGTSQNARRPVDDLAETWLLGVTLSWSIFDGGNKIARYQEAKSTVESARSQVRALELSVSQEVVQAGLNLQAAKEQIGAAQKGVESAKENYRLARGRFDEGVGTIIELSDAQLSLTQTEATHAQALANYRIGIAQLERALGRR